jgi:predicted RND superfamily exporter protein
MSPGELLDFVADTLLTNPTLSAFVPDSSRTLITEAREELLLGLGQIQGPNYSGAVVINSLPVEGDSTSIMVDEIRKLADEGLQGPHYWISEAEMYKELQEGFPSELMLLTVLTILSIFVIVAINFRSVFIPIPLIMTILSGVYVNVWASGLGGNTMYYLSYLIIQGILMGATIDYTILFTHYYLAARKEADVADAIAGAFEGSSHSILTSGLILIIVPYIMAFTMTDPMIASILRCLGTGSLAVVLILLFVLPGVIAALDPLFTRRKARL